MKNKGLREDLTFTIRYKDSRISPSLSVPKIAEIWDIGLIIKRQLSGQEDLRGRRACTTGARDQYEVHFGKVTKI